MNEIAKQGLFEEIQQAVQPLSADGNFWLDIIEANFSEGYNYILLHSPEVDIRFSFSVVTGGDEISCMFHVKKAKKRFFARYLFPIFGIDIPIMTDDSVIREWRLNERHREFEQLQIRDISFVTWLTNKHAEYNRIHGINYYPLENTGYIRELFRLSTEINKHLPEILAFFAPDTIEMTYLKYKAEQKSLEEIFRKRRSARLSAITEKNQKTHNLFPEVKGRSPIGNYEEVMNEIGKLRDISPRLIVTYHPLVKTTDILFLQLNIFIRQERDNIVTAYFLLNPSNSIYTFIKGREELVREKKILVFPGRNVFRLLGIPQAETIIGSPVNLGRLCRIIQDNISKINDAFGIPIIDNTFDTGNLRKTYTALIDMDNNIDEEIQKTANRYFADSFGPSS